MRNVVRLALLSVALTAFLIDIQEASAAAGGKDRPAAALTVEPLTDAQVQASIDDALHGKRHDVGVTLNDMQTLLLSAMACEGCGVSGYTITVLTPEDYIEYLAVQARREMMPFGLADVTPQMRAPVLHIFAQPSTATNLTGAGLSLASSVHRVVLTDSGRSEIVQPLEVTTGTVESNSALRSFTYQSAGAVFPMSEVARLRAMDAKGEFFIVVVGDIQNKYFKVKERYAKMLFR
jgi:hypothetical protein